MTIQHGTPMYSIDVFGRNAAGGYSRGNIEAGSLYPLSVGYANYLNDVPEAFFTLLNDDPLIPVVRNLTGRGHVVIWRTSPYGQADPVFVGLLGTEMDIRSRDIIFYCHGYLSILYWLHTDWAQSWSVAQINTIVSDLITRARTGIASSEFNWIPVGTIEAPPTTSGGSTPIVLPRYDTFYKRILFALRELAAIARSDTTNVTVFEVGGGYNPVFNFWKNRGDDKSASTAWEYGGDMIKDFRHLRQPALIRNQALGVGTSPRDLVLRSEQSMSVGDYGRRQEALLFQWVRDQTELDRITKLRLVRGNREYIKLELIMHPNSVEPPGAQGAMWGISDRVPVKIDRGLTQIDELMLATGCQVIYMNGNEYVRPIVEQRFGI